MSDLRAEILVWLSEQAALCAAATRGPWWAAPADPSERTVTVAGPDGDGVAECFGNIGLDDGYEKTDVAAFIASSRTVLPLALAALRAEVEAHGDLYGPQWCSGCGGDVYGDPTPAPCPTIERIHRATVGATVRAPARATEQPSHP